ncbi:hypothetical protein HNR23_001489 [Nocardiopsis mwathae]|uniref:DUF4389 domain-containing protein n=1 Tax=Nocardiopsis mwathae TaxID=1472723 RepID=A0A7W9YFW9_9ACTN|nr:DUF4389 domain-containing protein [Nocardiopsis mwathae]MBB6171429.1 hypothetical protein [Nocardiopsis mwathae]
MAHATNYPVRVEGELGPVTRWMWLVKWILAIPHWIVLFFLRIAFAILTVIAFFAILITARYPRSIFTFNVGVLRWRWRVNFYTYWALGTDRYPPFTLAEVDDYPAKFSVDYPERLSRGLVLIKWWLLVIPHLIVIGFFTGIAVWTTRDGEAGWVWKSEDMPAVWTDDYGKYVAVPGLIFVLVAFAAIALLFAGRYPRGIFDFVLGMNRWLLRVLAYRSLMTDRYPPFRMEPGGRDPGRPARPTTPPAEGGDEGGDEMPVSGGGTA